MISLTKEQLEVLKRAEKEKAITKEELKILIRRHLGLLTSDAAGGAPE